MAVLRLAQVRDRLAGAEHPDRLWPCKCVSRIALVFAATLLVIAGLATSARAAPPPRFFGITKGHPFDRQDFQMLSPTGVRAVRFVISWPTVEPDRETQNWTFLDNLIGNLAAHRIQPLPFVYGSPPWIERRQSRPPLTSVRTINAWRAFLNLAASRYGPDGSYWNGAFQRAHPGATPRPITGWQIWNEPNLRRTAQQYAKLVEISHDAITAVDSNATIVLAGMPGCVTPTPWGFLDRLYQVPGIKKYFDATALHPYAGSITQFQGEIEHVRTVMRRHHDAATPLWLTELGWGSARPSRRWPVNKGPLGQRRMLRKSFELVLRNRRPWHIAHLLWFDWRDPLKGTGHYCSFCDSAGLLRHSHRPKLSFSVYRRFALAGRQ